MVSLLIAPEQFGLLVDTEESTVSLMSGLGFTLKPEVDQLEPTSGYATQVSRERAGLLDADVTLAYAPEPEVGEIYLADPLVGGLGVVQRGAFIQVDRLLWGAFRNPSVLSIPYAVDQIVPRVARPRWRMTGFERVWYPVVVLRLPRCGQEQLHVVVERGALTPPGRRTRGARSGDRRGGSAGEQALCQVNDEGLDEVGHHASQDGGEKSLMVISAPPGAGSAAARHR